MQLVLDGAGQAASGGDASLGGRPQQAGQLAALTAPVRARRGPTSWTRATPARERGRDQLGQRGDVVGGPEGVATVDRLAGLAGPIEASQRRAPVGPDQDRLGGEAGVDDAQSVQVGERLARGGEHLERQTRLGGQAGEGLGGGEREHQPGTVGIARHDLDHTRVASQFEHPRLVSQAGPVAVVVAPSDQDRPPRRVG